MSAIDVSKYIAPLPGDDPSGPDLDMVGDADYQQLDIVSRGTPDQTIRVPDPAKAGKELEQIIPGTPPDARAIFELTDKLFGRTRDLRVAIHMAYSLARLHGLDGLAGGLQLIAELLAQHWDGVHPRISADYDFDAGYRTRVLMALTDRDGFLRAVRDLPFAEARAVGRFTLRDLEVMRGELPPLQGQPVPTLALVTGALKETPAEQLQAKRAAIAAALDAVKRIDAVFREKTGATGPELGGMQKMLAGALDLVGSVAPAPAAASPGDASPAGADAAQPAGATAVPVQSAPRPLATRADAKKMLEAVVEFMDTAEPAHPATMFVRRAIKMLDMNFLEIVKELAPDAIKNVRHLAGLPEKE